MNYHNITVCDMLNGDGLRVVLWVAGCNHYCKNCQNPQTWDPNGGLSFDESAEKELFDALALPYHSGITFSGGDPLYPRNRSEVFRLAKKVKELHPSKNVWIYTGYKLEDIEEQDRLTLCSLADVIVDGEFQQDLFDTKLEWVGSSNQRVLRKSEGDF